MAYSVQTVSAMTDIPAAVASVAIAQGWTVDTTNPNQPIFTLPATTSKINWQLSATVSGQDHTLTWTANGSAIPTSTGNTRSPKLAPTSGSTAVVPLPTKVHVFISPATPAIASPYLALAIEYNSNQFRHLYLGVMEALGNYTGGEVVSGMQGPLSSYGASIEFDDYTRVQYLFGSRSACWSNTQCGGVRVTHADNPNEWRKFLGFSTGTITSFPANSALGGFRDALNDGYLANGECNFAGSNPLVPMNLYCPKAVTGNMNFVPIGRPPAIRLVNMRNLEPGASIAIGGVNWRVFPAMRKATQLTMPNASSNGNWRTYETSYYVGYAYKE